MKKKTEMVICFNDSDQKKHIARSGFYDDDFIIAPFSIPETVLI